MTNLFSHLAARSLGLTPIVQPRIDSRFSSKPAAEPIASVSLTGTNTEFIQPESNGTHAIAESLGREDVTPFSLVDPSVHPSGNPSGNLLVNSSVDPAVNQNLSLLPIAHAPRPIAFDRTIETNDRDSSCHIHDTSNRNQPIFDERSVRGDRSISNSIVDVSSVDVSSVDVSVDTNPNITTNGSQTGSKINFEANQATEREPVLRTDTELDREISHRTSQQANIQAINTQNIRKAEIEIENSSVHPAAAHKVFSLRGVPEPSSSILPAAEATPSAIAEAKIESTTGDFTRSAIDSRSPQERSDLKLLPPGNPLGNPLPAPLPSEQPELTARAQSQMVPRTASQMVQPSSNRIEVRSRAVDVSSGVMPRQTAVLMPTSLPSDRSAARAIASEAPAALPTIRVTIGRIEVRAVSPPAPARPRAATTSARLSLEDYLRSRSGGNPSGGNPSGGNPSGGKL